MWQTVGQGEFFIIMTLYSLEDYKKVSIFERKHENFSLKNLRRMLFQKG
jgi:hypothetical protein